MNYRLHAREADNELFLLDRVYRELVTLAPDWLACETFRLDDRHSMVFLLEVDDITRLEQVPRLSGYLTNLAERCEGEPRAGLVERSSIDVTGADELGLWDPARRKWALPLG